MHESHTSTLNPHRHGVIAPMWVQLVGFSDPITAISHKAGGSLCPCGCVQGPGDAPRRSAQLLMSPVCWSTRWWLDWFSGPRPICYQHLSLLLCFGGRLIYWTVQIVLTLIFVYRLAWALIYDEEVIRFTVVTAEADGAGYWERKCWMTLASPLTFTHGWPKPWQWMLILTVHKVSFIFTV